VNVKLIIFAFKMLSHQIFVIVVVFLLIPAHQLKPIKFASSLDRALEVKKVDFEEKEVSLLRELILIDPKSPRVKEDVQFAVSQINEKFDGPLRIPLTVLAATVIDKVNLSVDFYLGYTVCKKGEKYSPEKCPLNKSRVS